VLEANKQVIRLLMEEDISRGNVAVAEEIIHPAFYDHTNPPGLQEGLDGHNDIVAYFRSAFPDLEFRIDELIAEGDRVVARTTMVGTQQGEFFGIAPTGRSVSVPGIHILRIADGKVAEHWGVNDDLSLMRQLGVVAS
jgi:predicted ester cyclase